jgi:hypothetical protein
LPCPSVLLHFILTSFRSSFLSSFSHILIHSPPFFSLHLLFTSSIFSHSFLSLYFLSFVPLFCLSVRHPLTFSFIYPSLVSLYPLTHVPTHLPNNQSMQCIKITYRIVCDCEHKYYVQNL